MSRFKNNATDALFEHMMTLETIDDCYAFFEDIATIQELKEFSLRFNIAKMLHEGRTYQAIEQETGASATTISRVSKCLHYGAGGYDKVFNRK
jgi:TrpR-related protein YerC/YecD